MATMLKKLSTATLLSSGKKVYTRKDLVKTIPVDLGSKFLARIIGIVRRIRETKTQFGESLAFRGEFFAKRFDGEEFQTIEAFFPAFFHDQLHNAFSGRPDGVDQIEFAIDLHIKRRDELQVGYEYDVQPVKSPEPSNAIASLVSEIDGLKALPAPDTTEASADKQTAKNRGRSKSRKGK